MSTTLVLCLALLSAPAAEELNAAPGGEGIASQPEPVKLDLVSAYQVVAMMPLSSLGSTDEVAQAIERVLVGEFKKLLGAKLITPEDLLARGQDADDAFMECGGVVVCLVEVVGGLGWDAFVVGNIAGLGNDRVINIKLIDVRTGGEVRRASEKASGDERQLIGNMRRAAVTLLAPELLVGTVSLVCPQEGVEITVNGQSVGVTPLANPRIEIPVGRHAIEANGDGLVPFSTLVDIAYGENKKVEIKLPRNTIFVGGDTPFRSRWWPWTIAGAGVLIAGMGGVFNFMQADTVAKIENRAQSHTLTVEHANDLFRQEEELWTTAIVLYIAGAVVITGVLVLFGVDLFGSSGAPSSESSAQ